jgi:rubrerythrin
MSDDDTPTREKWLNAYNDMMMRVRTAIEEAEESTPPALKRFVHNARDLAVDLEELTRDEAEKIAMYLHRDIEDAGKYLAETGQELGDWLRFDIHQVEDRLMETLTKVTDHTREEMLEFEHEIEEGPAWNSGEVTGPGTLVCANCGEIIRFHETGYIPNCPNCDHTVFHRKTVKDEL